MSDGQLRADELVSACLDGEATPAEIAEIERDDALVARVQQLRAVRDAAAAPVAPMSAELQDRMIEAALAAVDAETARRSEARIVPIHRRRGTRLAVAAAAVLLAAVVGTGLIAGRGGDDDDMAAEASGEMAEAQTAAAPAEAAADPTEAAADPTEAAMATTTALSAGPEEEPMAAQEAMPEADEVLDEVAAAPAAAGAAVAEAAVPESEAEPAAATDDAAATDYATADEPAEPSVSEDRREADTTDGAEVDDGPIGQVVDLGTFESLESLVADIAARRSVAQQDGAMAASGACSAAVHAEALRLGIETGQPFVAAVGTEGSLTFDLRFARRSGGTAVIIYAAPPGCETGIHEQVASDGS